MPEIKRSALMPYSAQIMYDIVNDVERYPEFLPWCGGARLEHADEHSLQAAILMQAVGLNHWFTTRNTMVAGESIDISLVEGPFSRLDGSWRFTPINAEGCKIEFVMNFEIKHGFAAAIITPAFARIANTLVESFCNRARQLHEH
jgi:ribosome-associated toxin RatA of RatAB toxin-antitoxin module